ncbi:MAG TPA: proton-conducting transporter membrane subunit, partial [Victivallales bacterium]|nr:proton-conducting transporter membrane subunit [Victivallales bacterium]
MLGFDGIGLLMLSLTSLLFLLSSIYSVGYISSHKDSVAKDEEEGFIFQDSPRHIFVSCMLLFCSAMTLVFASRDFGFLWVGIEATTFASAPLIYYYRHHRSLEAVWKYVMICSVGIGFSLIGNIFILAAFPGSDSNVTLSFHAIKSKVLTLDPNWIKVAFVFFVVGYGTKAGLAPLHSWLPSAHAESPAFISALLSGALLNCAFLGIYRTQEICHAAGIGDFSGNVLILLGCVSTFI